MKRSIAKALSCIYLLTRKIRRLVATRRDPVAYAKSLGVRVGRNVRIIGMDDRTFGSEPYLIEIGDHVTITGQVQFVTHDGGVWVFREREPDIEVMKPIVVGNNVFIGLRTIILPGVTIGSDVVIGAGSIVTNDIPAGSVAVGSPARVVSRIENYRKRLEPNVLRRTWSNAEDKKRSLLIHFFPES